MIQGRPGQSGAASPAPTMRRPLVADPVFGHFSADAAKNAKKIVAKPGKNRYSGRVADFVFGYFGCSFRVFPGYPLNSSFITCMHLFYGIRP